MLVNHSFAPSGLWFGYRVIPIEYCIWTPLANRITNPPITSGRGSASNQDRSASALHANRTLVGPSGNRHLDIPDHPSVNGSSVSLNNSATRSRDPRTIIFSKRFASRSKSSAVIRDDCSEKGREYLPVYRVEHVRNAEKRSVPATAIWFSGAADAVVGFCEPLVLHC